jgi:thiosulfate dehydrogenase
MADPQALMPSGGAARTMRAATARQRAPLMRHVPRLRQPASRLLLAALALGLVPGALRAQEAFPVPAGYAVPADSLIPAGPLGDSVRRGRAILLAARDSLRGHVGNRLTCTNCHREAGTLASSGPWVGSFASFPQYNARAGRVIRLEDRVNECLRRSLNGKPLDSGSRDMDDIVSYLAFLSRGVPTGTHPAWLGYRKLAPRHGDRTAGAGVYTQQCARCHGAEGAGTPVAPPLWGPQSFAIGAGMARLNTIAAFVRWNMPYDRPASLDDRQAYDVAAFVLSHPRPDTPGKEKDWPNGDPPADAAYPTLAAGRAKR